MENLHVFKLGRGVSVGTEPKLAGNLGNAATEIRRTTRLAEKAWLLPVSDDRSSRSKISNKFDSSSEKDKYWRTRHKIIFI